MRPHSLGRRYGLPLSTAALVALSLGTGTAQAAGGDSIATAPTIQFGALNVGGGKAAPEYWRVLAFAGDLLTVRSDNSDTRSYYSFEIYDPSVDDFRLTSATPINGADNRVLAPGKKEFTISVPFGGLGTIAVCNHNSGQNNCAVGLNELSSAFSFAVTAAHATSIALSGVPRRAKRGSRFRITARVQSPAGMPAGQCLFQPVGGHGLRPRGPKPLVGGSCSATVNAGTGRTARYRVSFEGSDGWQDDVQKTRTVLVQKRSSR